jgi:hypothetical protein
MEPVGRITCVIGFHNVVEAEKAKEKTVLGPFCLLGDRCLLFAAVARDLHIIVRRLDMGILR